MTMLYALNPKGDNGWIPIMHGQQISVLVLLAQLLEAQGLYTMFQMGVNLAYFAQGDPGPDGGGPVGI